MNDISEARVCCCAVFMFFAIALTASAQKTFQEDVLETSGGDVKITCIGHGTLMFTFGEKVIHVDPWSNLADYTNLPKADLILITHEHSDHLDAKAIQIASKADTVFVINGNPTTLKVLPNGIVMKNGESKTVLGIPIEAVPAYNLEKRFHPKGNGNGYILTLGDKRVYVAGDTENVPEIKALKQIDVAFLPMNQPYTMTPEQVADVAKAIRPKILYPYHFSNTDTSVLVNLMKDEKDIEVRLRDFQ